MATITLNDPKTVLSNQPLAASFLNNTETTVYKSDGEGNDTKVEYTVADVYDDAAVIGSELEKIITNYGVDVLKDLMPKVISVLELLENLTIKSERENEEKSELKMKIHSLEYEKSQRNNERERFEKELEEIEEKWQKESFKLIDMVNKLKDENKRLNDSLTQNSTFLKSTEHLVIKQEELDYIRQIKEENIKLKEINRFKEKEIEQKMTESEALTSQIETLSNTMLNFRRKQIVSQNQIEKMVKAKAELECTVTERDQQLSIIREKLHMHNIHKEDKSNYIEHDDDELEETKEKIEYKKLNPQFNENESFDNEVTEMIMINSKDPNRPRFTLKELQKVLMEKNQLTVKLDQTKDELEQLKKGDVMNQNDGEVQGPINKEPDDKIEGSKSTTTSGIRRFFSFFFSNNDGTSEADQDDTAVSDTMINEN